MKTCPVCAVNLELIKYEQEGVLHCPSCHGYLIDTSALTRIKKKELNTNEMLDEQLKNELQLNTTTAISCPRCHLEMDKIQECFPEIDIDVMVDYCESCKLLWLDGGEIVLLQQGYEASDEAEIRREGLLQVEEFKNNPERQQAFKDNLAKAKNPMNPVVSGMQDGVKQAATDAILGLHHRRRHSSSSPLRMIFSMFTRY